MDTQKQIIERLNQANNVLVTVKTDPSIDHLAAALGLSLALNKLDKHAAAVYSGQTPSAIEFLKPEETFEQTTDSLRDFIISLDKSKADKLRYKVEDEVVRIFITPYRSSITQEDLDFSQGDFNVDVVVALGVHEQQDIDQAVTAHGRILHDATVITLNTAQAAELGAINWLNEQASSLSEMVTEITSQLGKDVLDEQISTALLTGIVSETERFSNEKTTANTMKLSAILMAAGANQQLVATQLAAPVEPDNPPASEVEEAAMQPEEESTPDLPQTEINDDGTLQINHVADQPKQATESEEAPVEQTESQSAPEASHEPEQPVESSEPASEEALQLPPVVDEESTELEPEPVLPPEPEIPEIHKDKRTMLTSPPQESGLPPVRSEDVQFDVDGMPKEAAPDAVNNTLLHHDLSSAPDAADTPAEPEATEPQPDTSTTPPPAHDALEAARKEAASAAQTLEELEKTVGSPHVTEQNAHDEHEELNLADLTVPGAEEEASSDTAASSALDDARNAVEQASQDGAASAPEPIAALNAQPLGTPLHEQPAPDSPPPTMPPQPYVEPAAETAEQSVTMPLPPTVPVVEQPGQFTSQNDNRVNPSAPPPVPPPIMPPYANGQ